MTSPREPESQSAGLFPVAVVGVVVALILIIVAVIKVGGSSGEVVDWAVVGSADEGKVLVVVPITAIRSCDEAPTTDVRKSNANRVELEVRIERGDCADEGARPAAPLRVELVQPLRGQQITGSGLRPPAAYPAAANATEVPSIVGFRLPDARAILKARGLASRVGTGPEQDATEVTTQSPPPGSPATAGGTVTLRTVPR